jgi:hypothetical protein
MLRRPLVDVTPPVLTKEAARGLKKLAQLYELAKLARTPQEEFEEAALTDPEINAALDYEQAMAENAVLREQVLGLQQSHGELQQQMAAQEQQFAGAQQQMAMMQQQLDAETQGRQSAVQQALMAKDSELAQQASLQLQRQQLAAAADSLALQLKQLAATPPEAQMAQAAEAEQATAIQGDQAALQTLPSNLRKQVVEAQNAEQTAAVQGQQAEQEAAMEVTGSDVNALRQAFQKTAAKVVPPLSALEELAPLLIATPAGAGVGAARSLFRKSDTPTAAEGRLEARLAEHDAQLAENETPALRARREMISAELADKRALRTDRGYALKSDAVGGALAGLSVGGIASGLRQIARGSDEYVKRFGKELV